MPDFSTHQLHHISNWQSRSPYLKANILCHTHLISKSMSSSYNQNSATSPHSPLSSRPSHHSPGLRQPPSRPHFFTFALCQLPATGSLLPHLVPVIPFSHNCSTPWGGSPCYCNKKKSKPHSGLHSGLQALHALFFCPLMSISQVPKSKHTGPFAVPDYILSMLFVWSFCLCSEISIHFSDA